MRKKQIKHLTADNARKLQDKLNEEGIRKEHIVQILYNSVANIYVAIYER